MNPFAAGEAVYICRRLREMVTHESLIYEDKDICYSMGIYKKGRDKLQFRPTGQSVAEDVSLEPNPTSGRVLLRYTIPDEATGNIAVYDLMGRQVIDEKTLPLISNAEYLDLHKLSPAMYIVRFKSTSGYRKELKLIIE